MRKFIAALALFLPVGIAHGQAASSGSQVVVKEESPGLLGSAKVTPEVAIRTAKARVPGGTIKSAEIEKEDGNLIYSFDIEVPRQEGIEEVNVDAATGKVLAVEHESAEAEKAEKAKEQEHENKAKEPDDD
jgi:uncharacterized membrane protein YkoI